METAAAKALHFIEEELNLLTEVLESERTKLAIEIRHTSHRMFREDLKRRIDTVERLLTRLQREG